MRPQEEKFRDARLGAHLGPLRDQCWQSCEESDSEIYPASLVVVGTKVFECVNDRKRNIAKCSSLSTACSFREYISEGSFWESLLTGLPGFRI